VHRKHTVVRGTRLPGSGRAQDYVGRTIDLLDNSRSRFTTVAEGGMIAYEGSRLMVALRDVSARFRFAHPLNLFSGTVRWI